jgi:His/Glu/Gln/Arg/opine family amino acid ABC transporter permease subunit
MSNLAAYAHLLGDGAAITLGLAVESLAIGLVLGLALAAGKLSRHFWLAAPVIGITDFIRGVPEFLILLLIYFGGAKLLSDIAGDYVEVSPWSAGVAALSLVFAAYASETFRGAFLAVPKGQVEAARAYGFSRWRTFRHVQLPQLWRIAIPGLGNLWQVLIKDTALVSIVGLDDLMRKSKQAAETTKEPFTFFLAAATIYLAITMVSMVVVAWTERRSSRFLRRA